MLPGQQQAVVSCCPLPDSPNLSQSTAGGIANSVENSGSQDNTGWYRRLSCCVVLLLVV